MNTHVTACLLSFNRPEFLIGGVVSMIENADESFELLIHDDGSDSSPAMLEALADCRELGATVITNKRGHNQGQGTALNRMFGMASGEIIYKFDQDLTFNPGWLSKSKRLILDNPQIGLLGLFHYWHEPCDSKLTMIEEHHDWSSRTHILGSAFGVYRDTWEALGPFEEHSPAFAEDWVFQEKVTASAEYVCALPVDDLVVNHGFGVGPSTVVIAHDGNEGTVQPIHTGPYLIPRPESRYA